MALQQTQDAITVGQPVRLYLPARIAFGVGCTDTLPNDLIETGARRVFVLRPDMLAAWCDGLCISLHALGCETFVYEPTQREPSIADFGAALDAARDARADAVVGVGGGSVLDLAKLVAALLSSEQHIRDVFGINLLRRRDTPLFCVPTTAGTGSEVSPNAILLDEDAGLKKGVVSRALVPDGAYVDPALTVTLPPALTASTGLDALTHCIEAYANRFAHPMIDPFALEGIRLIGAHIERAFMAGDDLEARSAVALGSLYGGMCLGPVNTGAVHALAYPLGSEFHVPHGVSNAVLLPHVLAFNLPAAPARYARIAEALGVAHSDDDQETARRGIERVRQLCRACGIPASLAQLGVPRDAIPRMAAAALTIQRLLVRNVRSVTQADAEAIYRKAFE